jgi:sulfite reductase (NADPH) flavoprotein alpha-component
MTVARLWPWAACLAGVALAVLSPGRMAMAAGVVVAYAGFCAAILAQHRRRRAARAGLIRNE